MKECNGTQTDISTDRSDGSWQSVLYELMDNPLLDQTPKLTSTATSHVTNTPIATLEVPSSVVAPSTPTSEAAAAADIRYLSMNCSSVVLFAARSLTQTPNLAPSTPTAEQADHDDTMEAAFDPGPAILRTCSMIQASEAAETLDTTVCSDTQVYLLPCKSNVPDVLQRHDSLYVCVHTYTQQEVTDVIHKTSPLFTEHVRQLLRTSRLLSLS